MSNTANGAVQVNYLCDKIMSYGNNILKIDGQPSFGYKILEGLASALGEEELSDPEPTTVKFKNSTKELSCIPELNDVAIKAWVQFSYSMYKGEINEKVAIRRFYRATDGASGAEAALERQGKPVTIGERLTKDEAVSTEVKYEDGVTAEAVAAWKQSQMGNSDTPASKPVTGGFPKAKAGFPGAK